MNANVLMGGAIFAGGLLLAAVLYSIGSGAGYYTIAAGAIGFGAVQIIMGLVQGNASAADDADLTVEQVDAAGTAVILRSMISMAAADGRLDEKEIGMVRAVTRSIFGTELDESAIREMSQKMISGGGNIATELASAQHAVTPEDANLAVTGMAMVAMADGTMDVHENERLESYARALEVDQVRFDKAIEKARAAIAQLIETEGSVSKDTSSSGAEAAT